MPNHDDGGNPQPAPSGLRWIVLAAVAIIVAGAVLAWRYTPLASFTSPARLARWMAGFANAAWAPVIVVSIYVLAGYVFFPLTILIAATALIFSPALAFTCAMAGSLANACALYGTGRYLLSRSLNTAFGPTMQRTARALRNRGIPAVAVVRTIPLAPFTMVNLAAGALHVRFRDYVLGTALGLVPGITMLTIFGERLKATLENPSVATIGVLLMVVLLWIGLSLLLQRISSRWESGKQRER